MSDISYSRLSNRLLDEPLWFQILTKRAAKYYMPYINYVGEPFHSAFASGSEWFKRLYPDDKPLSLWTRLE